MNFILASLKKIYLDCKINRFNRRNSTRIRSYYASLEAQYGKNVSIAKDTYVESNVSIGDYSYINQKSYIENCTIGKYCSISSGVFISPCNHNYNCYSTHPVARREKEEPPRVIIGNDVWIGLNVIIKSGVVIGTGAVIGAGSIVTHEVAPYEIVAGVPAKTLGFRFDDDRIQKLLDSEWWNLDYNYLLNNDILQDIEGDYGKRTGS